MGDEELQAVLDRGCQLWPSNAEASVAQDTHSGLG